MADCARQSVAVGSPGLLWAVLVAPVMVHWTEALFVDQPELFGEFQEHRAEDAPEQVADLLGLLETAFGHEPDRVLDVACGIGRHLLPFAEAGLDAHGVDISPAYLERARERVDEAGVGERVSLTEGDMRDLTDLDGRYDLVTSFWTSVGYFDEAGNRAVFEGMYDRLADGGVAAFDVSNKEGVLSDFADSSVSVDDGRLTGERREYTPETSRMESTLHIVDVEDDEYQGVVSWDVRLYAPVEFRDRLRDAGFDEVRLYGSLSGDELTRDSTRMVVLGRKQA